MLNSTDPGSCYLTSLNLSVDRGKIIRSQHDRAKSAQSNLGCAPVEERDVITNFRPTHLPTLFSRGALCPRPRGYQQSKRALEEWERIQLILRSKNASLVDSAEFQERLLRASKRNTYKHITVTQVKRKKIQEHKEEERQATFAAKEAKRRLIQYRHDNMVQIRQIEKFIRRAMLWHGIIVSHVFLSGLIHERKVHKALNTFTRLLLPLVMRFTTVKKKRAAAAALTQSHMNEIVFPTPEIIKSMKGTFFQNWPSDLLEQLVSKAVPVYLEQGSYLMHEGDVGRNMFIITTGKISIILRKKNKDKRRSKENSIGVIPIMAPCYVGEFALVCKEARSASIYCETNIGYWSVLAEHYDEVAQFLSADVANRQREATDVRRRENLKKFFPLRVDFMRRFVYFEKFSNESLHFMIDNAEPLVLHDGDYIFKAGEMDSSTYFIQDGVAILEDHTGTKSKVSTGSCVSMFDCACGINERKRSSIVSVDYCDVWRLRRDTLIEAGLSEPDALLHCRQAAKSVRAMEMIKNANMPAIIRKDHLLSFCLLPSNKTRFYELCKPTIYLNGERLILTGQDFSSMIVIINGILDITTSQKGEPYTQRVFMKDATTNNVVQSNICELTDSIHRDSRTTIYGLSSTKTCILGAYEFASCLTHYTCTAVSVGMTEAFVVDKRVFEESLTQEQRSIMRNNARARRILSEASSSIDLSILAKNQAYSFVSVYKHKKNREQIKVQ